ncbi:hypothetical protein DEIPH_ctg017orf0065 [Deinococcus phoenicis]|uniref:DUF306 domain-containing protein n=1 Tax=Deinococcus phoenicis TaxID=1476583 RepID=A0A016QRN8_9DEIO|nr:hypothetical protein DEIPH_ctg017orf0065 [Deinococcus phoenicis]
MPSLFTLTALALLGTAGAQTPALTGTTWTLTQLSDGGRLVMPGRNAQRPTLRLDARTASGNTGCNVYRAGYAARGDILRFMTLAATRRACPDRMDGLEARFVNLMGQVNRYRLSGNTLTLFAGSRDRLVFTSGGAAASLPSRPPARPETNVNLDGTWTLTGGTALRPVPGSVPALTFAGGRVSGTGGCNRLMGTVQAGGDTLTFGALATTRMACAPAVNAQEGTFLAFLARPALRASVQGQVLTLTGANGQTLVFRRAGASQGGGGTQAAGPVQDGTYTLATVNGQPAPQTPRPVTLSLTGNRIGGNDGCNSFGGEYRLEGTRLLLTGPLASTLMACPDQTQEVDIHRVLGAGPALTVTPSGLTLTAGGTTLAFSRQAAPAQGRVQTWTVAAQRVPCMGVGPMSCLRIQRDGGPWELFYGEIEGFTFQPGVTQVIRVREEDRPGPVPADASSKRYVLVEVVERR